MKGLLGNGNDNGHRRHARAKAWLRASLSEMTFLRIAISL
jgi:hypothetical protein